jgi:Domain of unknown function (DUF4158)
MDDNRPRTRGHSAPAADISEDELARDWTLSAEDVVEIAQARGPDHRRRFALQLCTLRNQGRFLDDYRRAPLKIVNHLSRQMDLPPVLFLDRPGRAQTERAQELRIRRYLGLGRFDRTVADNLRAWLSQGAVEGRSVAELLARAEDKLRDWRIMLPAISTLERIVVAEVTRATTTLFDAITSRLPENLRASIDLLLEVPEGDARSSLFRLKSYPQSASAAVIKGDIVRLRLVEELLGKDGALADLDPKIVRQLGELGRGSVSTCANAYGPALRRSRYPVTRLPGWPGRPHCGGGTVICGAQRERVGCGGIEGGGGCGVHRSLDRTGPPTWDI